MGSSTGPGASWTWYNQTLFMQLNISKAASLSELQLAGSGAG